MWVAYDRAVEKIGQSYQISWKMRKESLYLFSLEADADFFKDGLGEKIRSECRRNDETLPNQLQTTQTWQE